MTFCRSCYKTNCICGAMCLRCGIIQNDCTCEQSIRPSLHVADSNEDDDEYSDTIRQMYGTDEKTSDPYWHGYNTWQRTRRSFIKCPYTIKEERRQYYRGVSDARYIFW